jgi:cytochrome c-type biogenesis protein CcmH/NrfG
LGETAIIARMTLRVVSLILIASLLVGCRSLFGPPVYAPSSPQPSQQPGTPQPEPGTPTPQQPVPPPVPPTPQQQPKEFRLGPASAALVKQSRAQSVKGEYPAAIATLERALRIEPDNPLVWLELGQVHLASRNAPQAESMGRKAIALATGNPGVQSSGWRLVGDALRARGRDLDATEAYQRAGQASPR